MHRRQLFQLAAGAAAIGRAFAAPASAAGRPAEEIARDEDFWTAVRDEFTTDRTVVNLNNGHVSPAPRTVQEAMRRYLDYSNMGPFHTMIRELDPRVASAKRMVAELAGVSDDEIVLTRNSTEALEMAEFGLNLKAGDEVLTTNQDYPHMLTAYQQRERRDGIKLTQISFPVPVATSDDLYKRFEQAITPQTKVIHFCHITNRTGVIFPVKRICDMAQARGIVTVVDGAHAFSQFPFKISDFNCDYYGVSLHKWTFAPVGTGFLYVRKSRIPETWPLLAANARQDASIRKFENIGTYPAANFLAICEAITFNRNIGLDRKAERLRYLRERWTSQLAGNPKVRILHSATPDLACGIGMFGLNSGDLTKLNTTLISKYGIYTSVMPHAEFTGMRITPSVYTTLQEIDYFAGAVETELKSL
jgi:selenocysteine lyase/cysteine desulfurase